MKILGIDPGYERVGIAILEKETSNKEKVLYSECFKTNASLEFSDRLNLIGKKIKEVIDKYKPEILAIETLFINTNQKTAMHVAEARGVIVYEGTRANLEIFEASPPQIKMAITSYGRANKEEVTKMVKLLTNIDKTKTSDDELDAIAIALTCSAHLRK